jgi:hypothetical protein
MSWYAKIAGRGAGKVGYYAERKGKERKSNAMWEGYYGVANDGNW